MKVVTANGKEYRLPSVVTPLQQEMYASHRLEGGAHHSGSRQGSGYQVRRNPAKAICRCLSDDLPRNP